MEEGEGGIKRRREDNDAGDASATTAASSKPQQFGRGKRGKKIWGKNRNKKPRTENEGEGKESGENTEEASSTSNAEANQHKPRPNVWQQDRRRDNNNLPSSEVEGSAQKGDDNSSSADGAQPEQGRRAGQGKWGPTNRKHEVFEQYYRGMPFFPADDEAQWSAFFTSLRSNLPTTFRLTPMSPFNTILKERLEQFAEQVSGLELQGEEEPVEFGPIGWYPEHNAWFLSASRHSLRKSPLLKQLHQFVTSHVDVGNMSRQEEVSMIPPFFLQVQSHHRVLDMCAAPGSKSAQMIESLHSSHPYTEVPTGLVIANDVDDKRCYMLVHQLKRLSSPCVMTTNYPAQGFPIIKLIHNQKPANPPLPTPVQPEEVDLGEKIELDEANYLLFDKVLCDVPCSGDATLRKNYDLWFKWHPGNAFTLHPLQVKIATRGARLLKIGGRMVYSTCSFNPVENEAVVAALLRRGQGALELVDVSSEMPGLKRSPGLTEWKIMDWHRDRFTRKAEVMWYNTIQDIPKYRKEAVRHSMFPPPPEEQERFHLERCMRVYPHQQNTGGFFIAVLQKVKPMPTPPRAPKGMPRADDDMLEEEEQLFETEKPKEETTEVPKKADVEEEEEGKGTTEKEKETEGAAAVASTAVVAAGQQQQQQRGRTRQDRGKKGKDRELQKKEEPFLPLSDLLMSHYLRLKEFYGIKDSFPIQLLMCRGPTSPRMSFLAPGIEKIIWGDSKGFASLINTGVRLFAKHAPHGSSCEYRLAQEGLPYALPYITKRIVHVPESDLLILVAATEPSFFDAFSPATRDAFTNLDIGCIVLVCESIPHPAGTSPITAAAWRAKMSVQLLISKEDIQAFRLVLLTRGQPLQPLLLPSAEGESESAPTPASVETNPAPSSVDTPVAPTTTN